jgi:hypothetical protein
VKTLVSLLEITAASFPRLAQDFCTFDGNKGI